MTKAETVIESLPPCNRYQFTVIFATGFICFSGALQLYGIAFLSHEVPRTCLSLSGNQTFNQTTEEHCEEWSYGNYEKTHSIVTQWDLTDEGKNHLVTLDMTLFLAFQMFGNIFLSFLSDKFGRRPMILAGLCIKLAFELILLFSQNIAMYIVMHSLLALVKQMVETTSYTLMAEWLSTRLRIVSNLVLLTFGLGILSLAGIAYFIRHWRFLVLIYHVIPSCIVFPLFFTLPESLVFLESKARHKEIDRYISKAQVTSEELEASSPEIEKLNAESSNEKTEEPHTLREAIGDIFRSPKMMAYTATFFWLSITLNLTYYTVTMNTMSLAGNEYLNFAISGAIEMPFVLLMTIFSFFLPRLVLICALYAIAALTFILSAFIPGGPLVINLIVFVGRGAIAGVYVIQMLYVVEMFPTAVRNAGLGLYQIGENMGPLIGPWLLEITLHVGFSGAGIYSLSVGFGLLSLVNTIIVSFLPETANQKLPERVADIENRRGFSLWRYCCK